MIQPRDKKKVYQESLLIKIPVLGYFFRKIKEHCKPIEHTLKIGKETEEEIKRKSFLGGLITTVSGRTFNTLKLRGKR